MAREILPSELWERIEPLPPPPAPKPKGGRPPVPNQNALRGILFVLKTGIRWVPFEQLIDSVPGVRHGRGRPRHRFRKLHADKAYDFRRCRAACRVRGILSRIARRGVETAEKLGKHRWVVERTFAWFRHFKRLTVRYERRADIHLAFLQLAACMICLSALG